MFSNTRESPAVNLIFCLWINYQFWVKPLSRSPQAKYMEEIDCPVDHKILSPSLHKIFTQFSWGLSKFCWHWLLLLFCHCCKGFFCEGSLYTWPFGSVVNSLVQWQTQQKSHLDETRRKSKKTWQEKNVFFWVCKRHVVAMLKWMLSRKWIQLRQFVTKHHSHIHLRETVADTTGKYMQWGFMNKSSFFLWIILFWARILSSCATFYMPVELCASNWAIWKENMHNAKQYHATLKTLDVTTTCRCMTIFA